MTGFLQGCATALVTPFTQNGVDYAALERLIERQIRYGADAVVVLGTTGEPSTMTEAEKESVIACAKSCTKNRCKLIVGTGGNCTTSAIRATMRAEALGADGVLTVTPYYNRCTQRGLIEYYTAICAATDLPVIAYNVPSRTGVNILPETMERLAEIPNMAGLKDACGNMAQTLETMRLIRGRCDLYSGEDSLNLPILCAGGAAVISVLSNLVPAEVKALCTAVRTGDLNEANRLNDALLPLCKACFLEVNPIPIKAALNLLGLCENVLRPPLTELEPEHLIVLRRAASEFGLQVNA